MIKEWFSDYIFQPVKNVCNNVYHYVTGKSSEEVDTYANSEGSANFAIDEHAFPTNENDIL